MEKPVAFPYDNQLSNYSMTASTAAPQPLTPITPLTNPSELPMASSGNEYYRRDSYPSSASSIDATPSSSGSSASYTSPTYSEAVVSPTTPESRRVSSAGTSSTKPQGDYDFYSPLNGLPETESIAIPPLLPPPSHLLSQVNFDDFDSLPDLLRQDRKADYTPRRPMNIYFIYMRVRRPELALHNPNLSTGDLSKLLGKEWNSMSPDQKAPWNELAERLMRAFKKKFPDYQYERGGGKKALKKRPRSAPSSISILNSNRAMVDAAACAAARRASASLHHHHPQMHAHIAHLPGRPLVDAHGRPHGAIWEHPQATYVYRTSTDEYAEYAAYPHGPVYAPIPTPLPTPGLPPQSYPPYGYDYAAGAPAPAPLSAPLDPHHMVSPGQNGSYPFPMSSPGFAPVSSSSSAGGNVNVPVAGPPSGVAPEGVTYYNQPPMYTPATEASSPWDEYMVQ